MTIAEKENIKAYIKAVRIEMDKRNAAILRQLASDSNDSFTAADVADIFD